MVHLWVLMILVGTSMDIQLVILVNGKSLSKPNPLGEFKTPWVNFRFQSEVLTQSLFHPGHGIMADAGVAKQFSMELPGLRRRWWHHAWCSEALQRGVQHEPAHAKPTAVVGHPSKVGCLPIAPSNQQPSGIWGHRFEPHPGPTSAIQLLLQVHGCWLPLARFNNRSILIQILKIEGLKRYSCWPKHELSLPTW